MILISNRTILEVKSKVKQDELYFSTSGGHIEVVFGPVHTFTLPQKCTDSEKNADEKCWWDKSFLKKWFILMKIGK